MNILVLAPHPFYQERGTPIDVDLLLRALSTRGVKIDLLTYREGESRVYENVTQYRASSPKWIKDVKPGFSLKKLICDLFLFFSAWRLVRRGKYDVIHAGEESVFFAMFLKQIYRIPYVYDMDSSLAQQLVEKLWWLKPLSPFFDWCETRAIRGSKAVAPVCPMLAELAKRKGATSVVTLHDISQNDNSQMREDEFEPDWTIRKQLEIDGTLALYVGNLERYQGVDLFLKSLQIARSDNCNVEAVIAGGQTEDITHYRRMSESLGIGPFVHFIGHWPIRSLGRLIAGSDILVVPRIKGINTPMKIYPFLHSGIPVLATDLPTHTQLIDKSLAYLASPDPRSFADGLIRLSLDFELRIRLGEAGRQFVADNHTYAHHEQRVNRLYDLVEGRDISTPISAIPR